MTVNLLIIYMFFIFIFPAYAVEDMPLSMSAMQSMYKEDYSLNYDYTDFNFSDNKEIKVCILSNIDSFKLGITSDFKVKLLSKNKEILTGSFFPVTEIKVKNNIIDFNNVQYDSLGLYISTNNKATISINGRRYRGDIEIRIDKKTNLINVINIISLENYLKGVISREISPKWDISAVKAQVIVARTYAVYKMQDPVDENFHVNSGIFSQVYGGRYAEDKIANKAVVETSDIVMMYKGEIVPAFYHSACGGSTEDADNLWKIKHPSLKGVKCSYCKESPHMNWNYSIKLKELSNKLKKISGGIKSAVKEIQVLDRSESNRAKWMKVIYKNNEVIKMSGNTFRINAGPDKIRSSNFNVKIKGSSAVFTGKGWGHGVGLCQWGAKALAEKGMNEFDILRYYYGDVEVVRLGQ
jgi:stage II sporulation protein D